jgi:uncharacterized protein YbjQ (UPF0145 family)
MKNFIPFVLIILLFSCKQLTHIERSERFFQIDFTSFEERGFLFSPNDYPGKFKAIGLVESETYPEANLTKETNDNEIYGDSKKWKVENINTQQSLESMYKHCIEIGADAVVNLEIEPVSRNYVSKIPVTINGYIIRGYAIKRQ